MSDLEQYAKEHQVPIMMDGGLKFLLEKLQENQCLSFLELGTAIARTSIEVAKLDPRMKVVTIERNPDMIVQAKKNIEESGLSDQITLIEGDALEVDVDGMFDCIFIDAAKAQYQRFFEKYVPYLKEDGFVLVDNLDFHGMIFDIPNIKNRNTRALVRKIKRFKDWIFSNEEYDAHYVQVGDGLCIITRKDHNENRN